MFVHYLVIALVVLAMLSIVLEEWIHINKAKTTLFFGCTAWVILFMQAHAGSETAELQESLNENLLEIATLWLFLMATMTFVAYLNARGFVQNVVQRVFPSELSLRKLVLLVGSFALLLSMICDNVTATLVSIGLVQAFQLSTQDRLKLIVLVVFAVNSGGVSLITGDVTTLMVFMRGHVTMLELVTLMVPSFISVVLLAALFSVRAKGRVTNQVTIKPFETLDLVIAALFFSTIVCTMLFNFFFSIPPVLTFLFGLSIMFLIGGVVHTHNEQVKLLQYIRQIEFDTLLFFLGILLIVGVLKEVGVLTSVATIYSQSNPDWANYIVGLGSALLDNVPLTAALLKAEPTLSVAQWLTLTYAVGVGGSVLVIGSAAGIIAMSKEKALTFVAYLKFFPYLLIAYTAGYLMTLFMSKAFF